MRSCFIKCVFLTIVFAVDACNHEKDHDDMFGKSPLVKALEKWIKIGGDLDEILSKNRNGHVKSVTEAKAICVALDVLYAERNGAHDDFICSPLHTLTAFFQQVENKPPFEFLKKEGLPRLRRWVCDVLDGKVVKEGDVMFILKILAMYRQHEDVELIAKAARKPIDPESYMWSLIFSQFTAEHPYSAEMIDALRDPLPSDFILVGYLDMANVLAFNGKLEQHPFDSQAGQSCLEAWLRDTNKENVSYALSATTALPFIAQSSREELLQVAADHSNPTVCIEAAWAQAKSGDLDGLESLTNHCLDPCYSLTAQQYLEELGHTNRIPEDAKHPDFMAIAEMAHWLAHPNEYGRPPDDIELFDSRNLFWPPTNDRRRLTLIKYTYDDSEGGDPDLGIGMVGSITFALFDEATVDLSPEDIYGIHCCWELEVNEDSRAPKVRTAKAGRKILARDNEGF